MKGQFFMIAGFLVLAALFIMANMWDIYTFASKNKAELSYDYGELNQITEEYENIINFQPNNASVPNNFKEFSEFLENHVYGFHHMSFVLFTNGTNVSVVVNNYYPQGLYNVSVIGTETLNVGDVPAQTSVTKNFYDTSLSSGDVIISYVYDGVLENDTIHIDVPSEKIYTLIDNDIDFMGESVLKKVFYSRENNN